MSPKQSLERDTAAFSRVTAPCPYFGTCGGCTLQDISYPDQLALKRGRLERAFAPIGTVPPIEMVPLEDPWRYRNKAELTFGTAETGLALGYHVARSFWRVVDLEDCLLLPEPMMRVVRDVHRLAAQTTLSAYSPRTHQGFFRYLLIRRSYASGRMLLCLMTTPGSRETIEELGRALVAAHPDLASLYWGLTARVADVAVPEELILLHGEAHLEDRVGPFRVQLAPLSFLQPTTVQAERIYARLRQAVAGTGIEVAWDLYCGVGLVSCYLAEAAGRVYGIDVESHHLELARRNASLNGLGHLEFRRGRVEDLLMDRRFWLQEAKPDLVVVDPPRAGLHPHAASSVLAARPKRIVYLSCNAQSLIRDLSVWLSGFPRYRLAQITAFDMFPHTNHLETLVVLERS